MRNALYSLGYTVGNIVILSPINGVFEDNDMFAFASHLSQNRLIYMRGNKENSTIGHAWVIDGCLYVKALYRLMATYDGTTWSVFQEMGTYKTCHNHINWGADGNCNGYFNGWIFNPNYAISYDVNGYNSSSSAYVRDFQYFTVTH